MLTPKGVAVIARSLVDPDRYLGTITRVAAATVQANMPFATAMPERRALSRGVVGDFVFIDCETIKLLGRITEIGIPDSERLTVEPKLGRSPETNPVGQISLFGSVDERQNRIIRGLPVHPKVGDAVYLADPTLFAELIADARGATGKLTLDLGELDTGTGVRLSLQPEKIFGRHCGVFGASGGGKSWTLAAILDQVKFAGGKAIIFDPTGEFANLPSISAHYAFDARESDAKLVHFPYRSMNEEDLFAIFRPSGQSQGPKLREAIRSLKLVSALGGESPNITIYEKRLLAKKLRPRAPVLAEITANSGAVHSPYCDFVIDDLPDQLLAECVYGTDRDTPTSWGGVDPQAVSYCETLNARVRLLINSNELRCLFGTAGSSLAKVLDEFFAKEDQDIIRVSFKDVHFEHNTREILMNIIGRFILGRARMDVFRNKPTLVILDEAHQFLGRIVGDEYANVHLDSFGLIAKEGRKYGLTCVLATQRPRDIPADVLSQLGTFVVHRLTNDDDRMAIERACGDLDRNAAKFVPTLAPGEAIIIGPDLPAPVPIRIGRPLVPPNSSGPNYDEYWRSRRKKAPPDGTD